MCGTKGGVSSCGQRLAPTFLFLRNLRNLRIISSSEMPAREHTVSTAAIALLHPRPTSSLRKALEFRANLLNEDIGLWTLDIGLWTLITSRCHQPTVHKSKGPSRPWVGDTHSTAHDDGSRRT